MKSIFHILTFLLFAGTISAQRVSGLIETSQGIGIEEAFVQLLKSTEHTHTNQRGFFTLINDIANDTLIISSLGYETEYIAISSLEDPGQIIIKLTPLNINLDEIIVRPGVNINRTLNEIDLANDPVNSSQEIMRTVPGLFIGQHAGGGKAEQIFLRGFDIDHGTDINLTVDGMPVNMTSHAHGQGYADLHFVIPETVEGVSFSKGPYDADKGNFATAGYVGFQTKDRLENSTIIKEYGQFNTDRTALMLSLLNTKSNAAYIAGEYRTSGGPFESPQNFKRLNVFGKYKHIMESGDAFTFSTSYFTSDWDASGQIPDRAVESGLIGRFGAIDDTEGGFTSRANVNLQYEKTLTDNSTLKAAVWGSSYDFELYSNFTFFLDDSENGDQIRQKENRSLYGVNLDWAKEILLGNIGYTLKGGLGLRNDYSTGNELSKSKNRSETLTRIQLGDVAESNSFAYISNDFESGDWHFNASLRYDAFSNSYKNDLIQTYNKTNIEDGIFSPKASISYTPSNYFQVYGKAGYGFHSNDTRISIYEEGRDLLAKAVGADLGVLLKPTRGIFVDAALWALQSDEELVYVGDAGIIEPSGQSFRYGVDLGLRFQLTNRIYARFDGNYTIARSTEDPEGANYIPLAPPLTSAATVNFDLKSGLHGSLKYRYITDRPANEDNSIVARGYFVSDANLGYRYKAFDFGFIIENVFNTQWNEAQFATESRLKNEAESVEEIHFTPGTPFFIRGRVAFRF